MVDSFHPKQLPALTFGILNTVVIERWTTCIRKSTGAVPVCVRGAVLCSEKPLYVEMIITRTYALFEYCSVVECSNSGKTRELAMHKA